MSKYRHVLRRLLEYSNAHIQSRERVNTTRDIFPLTKTKMCVYKEKNHRKKMYNQRK